MGTVPYEKIVAEDLQLSIDPVTVTMPAGGTATGHGINPATFAALAFAAIAVGTQSLLASTLATIEMSSEEFDVHAWFNPGTYTFTPQKAGYYLFTASVSIPALTGNVSVGIYKNGVLVDSVSIPAVVGAVKAQVTTIVAANGSTDAFTAKAMQTSSGALTISAGRFTAACVGGL